MTMSAAHRKTLDRMLEVLADDLDVTPTIIHLKSKDILTETDVENISAKISDKEKVMELIKIIKKRGNAAYPIFKEYLENCQGSQHLAEEMTKKLTVVEEELQGLKLGDDSETQIDKWNAIEEKFYCMKCNHNRISDYQTLPEKINILLIGKTGSGKSATGNTILGQDHFKASNSSVSVTKTIDAKTFTEGGKTITVVDTPGLFDTAKSFENKELVLEIAKTIMNVEEGIHLFLLVCNSTRFTTEEKETISTIEKVLTRGIYTNCVIVVTNANGYFGASRKESLGDYVAREQQQMTEFGKLLQKVEGRIIAVENCFEDEYLEGKQRERLLCGVAQVIQDNNGRVFSNETFENVLMKVERQEEERKKRIETKREKAQMRKNVHRFLLQKYFKNLPSEEFDNLLPMPRKTAEKIMLQSGSKQLQHVTVKDVQDYLVYFINYNKSWIESIKDTKVKETKQQDANKKRRHSLQERQKLQSTVVPLITIFLKEQSKEQLEQIIQDERIPDYEMEYIIHECTRLGVISGSTKPTHIRGFVKKTLFKNPTEIQKYIDDKILEEQAKELKLQQIVQEITESLQSNVQEAIERKSEKDLQNLKTDLENPGGRFFSGRWSNLINQVIAGHDFGYSDINIQEISKEYMEQNSIFLISVLKSNIEKRRQEEKANEEQRLKVLKINAFIKISELIKVNLKSYLTGKTKEELIDLDEKIKNNVIPKDIFDRVYEHLSSDEKQYLPNKEIESEIAQQIQEQRQIIEECLREAGKCFPGSAVVDIKGIGISKIENVTVDDEVLVFDYKGNTYYEKVYLITHANSSDELTYVRLQTSSLKDLLISPCHLLPVGNISNEVAARDVVFGDVIFTLQDGVMKADVVSSISYIVCRGAFCPMTMNGTIVVNDVATSCYTTFVPSRVAHILLAPVRVLFSYLPRCLFDKLLPYEEEEGMPIILLKCRSMLSKLYGWHNMRLKLDAN